MHLVTIIKTPQNVLLYLLNDRQKLILIHKRTLSLIHFIGLKFCLKTYFSFPNANKNPKQYARWIESINKDAPVKIVPNASSRVCSNHFCTDMVDKTGQRVVLKLHAVPTIFPYSKVCD